MKVILTTNIKKLGKIGELVSVKDGFARNFLFPQKMALRENKKNLEYYENIKDEIEKKENDRLKEAKKTLDSIKKLKIVFKREADDKGQLYGSISKKDILSFLNDNKIIVHSDDIIIQKSIRSLGEHEIFINPYIDISEKIKILVNKN